MDFASLRLQLHADLQDDRLKAVELISQLPRKQAQELLSEGLEHWDWLLRDHCAEALFEKSGEAAVATIISYGKKRRIGMRKSIEILSRSSSRKAAEYIFEMRNRQAQVGQFAVATLKAMNGQWAVIFSWLCDGKWNPEIESAIRGVGARSLIQVLRKLSHWAQIELFAGENVRDAFLRAGLWGSLPRELRKHYGNKEDEKVIARAIFGRASNSMDEERNAVASKVQPSKDGWIKNLAKKLEISAAALGPFLGGDKKIGDMYYSFEIPKRHGGTRRISAPAPRLKKLQRRVYEKLLANAEYMEPCRGFMKGIGIKDNAKVHTGQPLVINMDLRDFFPSVPIRLVYRVFRNLAGSKAAGVFLAALTTKDGVLPQGAPTSPALANLVCKRMDLRLQGLAASVDAKYTRYADDLTFSGPENIIAVMPLVRKIVEEEGFAVAEEKTRIMRNGRRQEVTGLVVNENVSLPRDVRRRLRAAAHHQATSQPLHWDNKPMSEESFAGRLAFLQSVQPDVAVKLKRKSRQ